MTGPLTFNMREAADRLGSSFTYDWLKAQVREKKIPFGKTGKGDGRAGRIFFTAAHLERILALYSIEPSGDAPAQPVTRRRAS